MKTSELTGAALDWAVAKCEGAINGDDLDIGFILEGGYSPSTDWAQGGPIIEREGMGIWMYQWDEEGEPKMRWYAEDKYSNHIRTGPTPLIAAMRCYVASKLGYEVEIPELILDGEKS
jgi:hypothetical protein